MPHDFQHRSQDERRSMAEQLAKACQQQEEEVNFSAIFQPPNRKPETD
jgi:hypothetical protein